ncbi:sce7726 family protein [Fluviicola taffensis]|uniref:sce7726 family protein n=1 Tax=Fluviicola taffensis TaxID=191579 RepID=UPI0031384981
MLSLTHDKESLRSLSQLLSNSVFKNLVNCNTTIFSERINKHLSDYNFLNYSEFISTLYKNLVVDYRNEYVYKNTLINELLLNKYSLETTTVINEFNIGSSIADFVLLNGEARVYEIKTEYDSLDKLTKQVSDYLKFADKVYVVASTKFIEKLLQEYFTTCVGIIEFTDENKLITVKDAQKNELFLDHLTIFKVLRKSEYLEIVKKYFGFLPNVPNTRIFKECFSLIETIDIFEFQSLAIERLKKRQLRCPDLLLSDETPYELKHICYSLNLNKKEYQTLFNFLTYKF